MQIVWNARLPNRFHCLTVSGFGQVVCSFCKARGLHREDCFLVAACFNCFEKILGTVARSRLSTGLTADSSWLQTHGLRWLFRTTWRWIAL